MALIQHLKVVVWSIITSRYTGVILENGMILSRYVDNKNNID